MSLHHGKSSFSVFRNEKRSHSPVTFEAKPQHGTLGAWSKVTQIIRHKKCWIQKQTFLKKKKKTRVCRKLLLGTPPWSRHAPGVYERRRKEVLIRFLNGSQWTPRCFNCVHLPRSNNSGFSTRKHFKVCSFLHTVQYINYGQILSGRYVRPPEIVATASKSYNPLKMIRG